MAPNSIFPISRTRHAKRILLFALVFMQCTFFLSAQNFTERKEHIKANSHWILPYYTDTFNHPKNGADLDLNTNPPTVRLGTQQVGESATAVADTATGALLFYSNGEYCRDKNFDLMPNGNILPSGNNTNSTNQASCIVPMINQPGKYYLFSLMNWNFNYINPSKLYYSVVDMSLNGGLGDIVSGKKTVELDSGSLHEGMIAIPGNNCDVWLLVHPIYDTVFKAYHITENGIDTIPVISSPGSMINGAMAAFELGGMGVSPDGKMVAITSYSISCLALGLEPSLGGLLLARFDPETGKVSDGIKVSDSIAAYVPVFSADNSKLYVAGTVATADGAEGPVQLLQYDVSNYNNQAIISSKFVVKEYINAEDKIFGLRRRGDTIVLTDRLSYIASSNQAGAACNFQVGPYLTIDNISPAYSLGNDVIYPWAPDTIKQVAMDTIVCRGIYPLEVSSGYNQYLWDNGSITTQRTIEEEGVYWVKYDNGCHYKVDTFIFNFYHLEPVINVDKLDLSTTNAYNNYQWLLNGNLIAGATSRIYTVKENGAYRVIVTDEHGCSDTSDAYNVTNVSIQQIHPLAKQISTFPNPTQDGVIIQAPIQVKTTLHSIEGKQVEHNRESNYISVKHLAPGMYFLHINDLQGNLIKVEKLVKSR